MSHTPRPVRRMPYRRAFVLALAGVIGLATPALAANDLDDIRQRLQEVEQEQQRTSTAQENSQEKSDELDSELQATSDELLAADQRLRDTTAKVEEARIVLAAAEEDLKDAEAEADRIDTELAVARANESQIEEALASNAEAQTESRSTVGAIARESYKQGGMGSLGTTLDVLSGESDAMDQMSMARTVLRVQDQQIRSLATQEAQQVAEQDRLAGVRQDIAYLLARAEAVVVEKEQAREAADAARAGLEALEAEQAAARAALEQEKERVETELAEEQQLSTDLEDQLAELARTRHGLEVEERDEMRRLAEEEARRQAEEEARRQAAEEEARRQAAEEEARRQAAEREAQRQAEAAAEAQRRQDEQAAADAQRRQEAAEREAAEAARAKQEADEREAAEAAQARQAAEQRQQSRASRSDDRAATPPSSGNGAFLAMPTSGVTTSEFGNRLHPVLGIWRLHAGLDWGAGCGTPVYAAADGTVFTNAYDDSRGNYVVVDHGTQRGVNLTTTYMHFQNSATVSPGQSVSQGQLIGHVGTTGHSTGCHLHFETRENGNPVNPRSWL